jgi:signal transduction histidine kinase
MTRPARRAGYRLRVDLFAKRLGRAQLVGLDCLAAWVFVLVYLGEVGLTRAGWVLALAAPLAVRRRWPRTVFAATFAVACVLTLGGVVTGAFGAPAYAIYTVAVASKRRVRVDYVVMAALIAVLFVSMFGVSAPVVREADSTVMMGLAAVMCSYVVGLVVRERRAFAARDAERLAQQAVTEERLRIARELHDVVAHSVGLIAVKASVANHVIASRPQEARDALSVIEDASRDAMTEMRQLLGVLRSAEAPDLGPAPGLDGLAELAERARLGGVEVRLRVGDLSRVPPGVGLSVYRIVQEALTNVVKHAAPAASQVTVDDDGGCVRVEVLDDGPGRRTLPGAGTGHGLIGMRERVTMYGGTFEAGPGPRGFRVAALLPYGGPE